MATPMSTLRTELKARMMNRGGTNSISLTDDRHDFALRAAIRHTANPNIHRHAELEQKTSLATVAGTDEYLQDPPPWAIWSIRCTTPGNIRRIIPIGSQVMDEIEKTSGPPLQYSRYGRTLSLDPIPDAVYALIISAYRYPVFTGSPMTGNCPLHEMYDEAVLIYAEGVEWKRFLMNTPHANELFKDWKDEMGLFVSPDEGDRDDQQDTLEIDYGMVRRY